ncbi:MAG: hypothetical protein PHO02_02390 [Candidatus Nanoarchaeia archaeon]|nr:hypothetical protein [Candidatus Nanoarchaeia archaeon]
MVELVQRRISRKNIAIAAIITFLFFSLGILMGVLLTEKRVESLELVASSQKLDYESMQLQTLFLEESTGADKCLIVSKAMEAHMNTLSNTGDKIETYIQSSQVSGTSFEEVKREYILAQLKYWLLAKKAEKLCSTGTISIIYFYSNTEACSNCGAQSRVLTHLKEIFPDELLVFSFDASFEQEAMIQMLKTVYGITSYPTLLVDDRKHEGMVTEEELVEEICAKLGDEHPACSS